VAKKDHQGPSRGLGKNGGGAGGEGRVCTGLERQFNLNGDVLEKGAREKKVGKGKKLGGDERNNLSKGKKSEAISRKRHRQKGSKKGLKRLGSIPTLRTKERRGEVISKKMVGGKKKRGGGLRSWSA